MDDLKTFCCQNPACDDYGRRGLDNLRVCFRYGPNKATRVLACRTCQQRFSERKGTALYRCKLPEDRAVSVSYRVNGPRTRRIAWCKTSRPEPAAGS